MEKLKQTMTSIGEKVTGTTGGKPILFVQGATGNCGAATVRALSKYKDRYTIIAGVTDLSKTDKIEPLTSLGAQVVEFSTDKPETYNAMRNASKVAIIPPNLQNRAEIAKQVADIAFKLGVECVVVISVLGCEFENTTFAREFRAMEKHIENTRLKWTFLRCVLFMDNYLAQADGIKKGTLTAPFKDGKYAPAMIRDVGEAVATCLTQSGHENRAYDITGPESLSGQEQARIFSEIIGRPVQFISSTPEDTKKFLMTAGMQEWQASGTLELFDLVAQRKLDKVSPNLEALLGKKPSTLADFVKFFLPVFRPTGEQAV